MKAIQSKIPGCYLLRYQKRSDLRGDFIKTFNADEFTHLGLDTTFCEQYYSWSVRNVVRGMHFQLPPYDHAKVVHCFSGVILDVVIDLRTDSPAFGQTSIHTLTADDPSAIYVPRGCAHGFCGLADKNGTLYNVTSGHVPQADAGVLWSSVDVDWPLATPIISLRDAGFPALADFHSPFRM